MDSSIAPSPASVPSSTSGLIGTTSRAPSPPSSPTAPSSSTSASRATTFKATILPLRQNPHHRSFRPLLIKPLLLLLRRLLIEQPSDVCIQIQSPWCPLSSLSNIDDHLCFKYQLLDKDLDALISVTNNEDLYHMMLEYDYLHHSTTRPTARLRNFSFIHPKKARDSTEVRCTVPIDESFDFTPSDSLRPYPPPPPVTSSAPSPSPLPISSPSSISAPRTVPSRIAAPLPTPKTSSPPSCCSSSRKTPLLIATCPDATTHHHRWVHRDPLGSA